MNDHRLTKKIINYITKIKATSKQVEELRKEMVEVRIKPTETWNKEVF